MCMICRGRIPVRYVLYSEELGVYLGHALGLGFWSKLDPAGQNCAVTFETESGAARYLTTWDHIPKEEIRTIPVKADIGTYASITACKTAGIPGWDPNPKREENERSH